ncbi:MAG: hypothetical protein QOK48_3460, partial [Blastocatellia bacterium]|nr:hypothetical protein [Blastocatellia bacterium]
MIIALRRNMESAPLGAEQHVAPKGAQSTESSGDDKHF